MSEASVPSAPSDAVALKMAEIREEAERRRLESERQKLIYEAKRKQAIELEMVTFEANLRLIIEKMILNGQKEVLLREYEILSENYSQFEVKTYPPIEVIKKGFGFSEFRTFIVSSLGFNLKNPHTHNESLFKDKLKIIASLIDPIKAVEDKRKEEESVKARIEKDRRFLMRVEAISLQYDKMIQELISSKHMSLVHVLPRGKTDSNVTMICANYQKYGDQMALVVRKMHHRLDITVPQTFEIFIGEAPVEWNNAFQEGKLPCLTKCPICGRQNYICGAGAPGRPYGAVQCPDHYEWDPETNTHYKYVPIPPPEPHLVVVGYHHRTHMRNKWNPLDPDGKIAIAEAKEKRRQELLKELALL
jgi:hypothetical protein